MRDLFVTKPPQVCPGHQAFLPQLCLTAGDSLPSTIGEVIPLLSSIDVTLWPGGPEDWPDVFHSSLGVSADCPGQRPPAGDKQMLTRFICWLSTKGWEPFPWCNLPLGRNGWEEFCLSRNRTGNSSSFMEGISYSVLSQDAQYSLFNVKVQDWHLKLEKGKAFWEATSRKNKNFAFLLVCAKACGLREIHIPFLSCREP